MPYSLILIGVLIESFLLGSIPSGVIISRLFYHKDVRDYGSGNIGTTNSFRALGKVGGSIVFVMDFLKGMVASLIAWSICQWLIAYEPLNAGSYQVLMALSFLGAVSGHIYSPWLHFKGGKGIATAIGSLFLVFGPLPSLLEIAIFAVLVLITKKVSVGSLAAAIACPFIAIYVFWTAKLAWLFVTAGAVMILYAHRDNIRRLRDHSESSLGSKTVSNVSSSDTSDSSEGAEEKHAS